MIKSTWPSSSSYFNKTRENSLNSYETNSQKTIQKTKTIKNKLHVTPSFLASNAISISDLCVKGRSVHKLLEYKIGMYDVYVTIIHTQMFFLLFGYK